MIIYIDYSPNNIMIYGYCSNIECIENIKNFCIESGIFDDINYAVLFSDKF